MTADLPNPDRPRIRVGVLALQGDFAAHVEALSRASLHGEEVRRPPELAGLAGLIMPGGESTTMLKFLKEEGLWDGIRNFARDGGSVFGTCAGAILLASRTEDPYQPSLGLLDIDVIRNAYGRQIDSFIANIDSHRLGPDPLEAVFIRAPRITRIGPEVEVLAVLNDDPVLVRQGNILAATFHPELTADSRIHRLFGSMIRGSS